MYTRKTTHLGSTMTKIHFVAFVYIFILMDEHASCRHIQLSIGIGELLKGISQSENNFELHFSLEYRLLTNLPDSDLAV